MGSHGLSTTRTGEGPILRDFVQLQLDVILQGLDMPEVETEIGPASVHRLFEVLSGANDLNTRLGEGLGDERLTKILDVVRHIRLLAYNIANPTNNVEVQQYYWGILFDLTLALTYRMSKIRTPEDNPLARAQEIEPNVAEVTPVRKLDHALWTILLLGGMICYRLLHKRRNWPPPFEAQPTQVDMTIGVRGHTDAQPAFEEPPMTTYRDFHIYVSANGDILAESEEGERRDKVPLHIPSDVQLALALIEANETDEKVIKGLGIQLYEMLFPRAIDKHFNQTEAVARDRNQGMRVRLTFDTDALSRVPWEFIYRNEGGYFMSINPDTVFSRYLELPLPGGPHARSRDALDLLLIIAAPTDQGRLNPDEWEQLVSDALADPIREKKITVRVIKKATRRNISDVLLEKSPNIVQFVGHGIYQNGRGYLALVDGQTGGTWLVDDERFAGLFLGAASQLGLVSLATCDSAKSDSPRGFLGIAPRLVQRGIPAVIAMQYSVQVSSAKVFLDQFYRSVAARKPIDWALQSARNAVYQEFGLANREFATPVLYMRAKDGQVF